MRDFRSLSVLARTKLHVSNLLPEIEPDLGHSAKVIHFPLCDTRVVVKVATRAALPESEFVYRVENRDFDPHNNTWYEPSRVQRIDPFPVYSDAQELQFQKFLLQDWSGKPKLVNPLIADVRRYCIRNPIPKFLFRGSIHEGDNYLGSAPGTPYWVEIPENGTILIRSADPDLIRKCKSWYKMGLTWLGKPIFEKS